MAEKKKDPREGHRQRLKDKFWAHGLDKLTDAEILEILLSFGTPRRDCKLTARAMLEKFGTLRDVFEADRELLAQVPGAGPSNVIALKLIHAISGKYLEKRLISRNYLTSSTEVRSYLRHDLESQEKEIFKVIYLNNDNVIISIEDISRGSISEAYVHPREVLERAIALRGSSLVLVHNHPTGSVEPSDDDQRLTRRMVHIAYLAEMKVLDHIIIGQSGDDFSFRANGLIMIYEQEIRETYRLKPRPGGGLLHEVNASAYQPRKQKSGPKSPAGRVLPAHEPVLVAARQKGWIEDDLDE
ncbi:DNA repair protein RadC [Deltaproteobacteria bacterium OttesenSCG-928-K17]|nr:DNA repair protein RadC [Deltaproteobacteria bacterium OttesenSCG-928-K17]